MLESNASKRLADKLFLFKVNCEGLTPFRLAASQCSIEVLEEIKTLEFLALDGKTHSFNSIFKLQNLRSFGMSKWPYEDLVPMKNWTKLKKLILSAGKLRSLEGIPSSTEDLDLSYQRFIVSLKPLHECKNLKSLAIGRCKYITDLDGLQYCENLETIGIYSKGEPINNLQPLRNLKKLKSLGLADGTVVKKEESAVLYELHSLKELVISEKSCLDVERMRKSAPGCDIRVVM